MGIVEQLVMKLQGLENISLSRDADVWHMAKLCILDALGCGIYGATTPEGLAVFNTLQTLYGSGEGGMSWGHWQRLPVPAAALANGTACHARELDDVNPAILHPGAVVIPAVLAVAEWERIAGWRVLQAVVAGYEVMTRISEATDYLAHRHRGWHATSTIGPFGAAVAVGWLLGLDHQALTWALGLAGTRTGGSWAFAQDGAMSKRLHPGAAARDGVISAYLAARGFTGPSYILEADDGGFFPLTTTKWDSAPLLAPVRVDNLAIFQTEFKFFACCKSVHSPAEAALGFRAAGIDARDIASITVEVNSSAYQMAGRSGMPQTVTGAQLSIPFGIAVALLYGSVGIDVYTTASLGDAAVRSLVERTRVVATAEMDKIRREKGASAARVRVRLKDNSERVAYVERPRLAQQRGVAAEGRLHEKFCQLCTAAGMEEERVARLRDRVMHLDSIDGALLREFFS